MKPLIYKKVPILAGSLMGLMLTGCQQSPNPPVIVNQPPASSTTTNTETKQVETPAPPPNPNGTVQTKSSETTTTTTKQQ